MSTATQHVVRRLIAWRWYLLSAAAMLAAVAIFPAQQLGFDRSIEAMFAPDDPLLPPYRRMKRTFGGNEVVLVAYVDPQLMSDEGLARLKQLTDRLAAVEGVNAALSLMSTPLGAAIARQQAFQKLLEGYAVGADRQTAAVVCILKPQQASAERTRTLERLREIAAAHDRSAVLAGEPVMVEEGFRAIEDDGKRLGWICNVLLMGVILAAFRSLRWMLVPLAVVQLALLLTQALLVWSQVRLSMVSSMLWAIVTVVGIATVVHIIVAYREARGGGSPAADALELSGRALAAPVGWSVLTTMGGFASLLAASVGPVQDFGLMMSVGTLMALVAMCLLIPGIALAGKRDLDPRRAWGEDKLEAALCGLLAALLRRPWMYTLAIAVVSAAASLGSARMEVETDFTRNFRQSSRIVQAYALVETRLGGAGVWDIVLPAPEKLNVAYIDRLRALQTRLHSDPQIQQAGGLTKMLSLADALDVVPGGGLATLLPPERILQGKLMLMETTLPAVKQALYGRDPETGRYYARIMLRARERQPSRAKQALIRRVAALAREEFPSPREQQPAEVTGFFVLLANLIQSMVRDQWLTLAIAAAVIYLMMLVAVRDWRIALIGMAPNMAPILVLMGVVGWLGFKLNMGAAMIAAVSMGMSIDSSLHYIIAYRRLRRSGRSVEMSLARVQRTVGRAASLSTLALIVGFTALCWSEFVPTIYFGALVSLALFGGMLGNIIILPLLLYLVERKAAPRMPAAPPATAATSPVGGGATS